MALIKCSNCSGNISDKATVCPKCGTPVVTHTQPNSDDAIADLMYREALESLKLGKHQDALDYVNGLLAVKPDEPRFLALKAQLEEQEQAKEGKESTHPVPAANLVACNNCGHMISARATKCPKCGTLVNGNNESWSESHSDEQMYSQQERPIILKQKKKTPTALITTIALLSLAVLGLGGFALYKMVYEPSMLANRSQLEEVLLDTSDEVVNTTVATEEQTAAVHEEASAAIEEAVEAIESDYTTSDNAWLAQRYATTEDIIGLSSAELRILRNSIFARHGRYFKDPELQEYFNSQSWYSPYRKEVPIQELNDYERKNVEFLKKHE